MNTKKLIYICFIITSILLMNTTMCFGWSSKKDPHVNDTHKLMAQQGLKVLENDWNNSAKDKDVDEIIKYMKDHMFTLKAGAAWPDFASDRNMLFADHFYDPDTGENFTEDIPFIEEEKDARDKTTLNVIKALQFWKKGEKEQAMFALGCAFHFYGDIWQPHHSSNKIAGPFQPHGKFEKYVENKASDYLINTTYQTIDGTFYQKYMELSLPTFVDAVCYDSAQYSQTYKKYITMRRSKEDWDFCADKMLKYTQRGIAKILYKFAVEASKL